MKQRIVYKDFPDKGENIVWDISDVEPVGDEYVTEYISVCTDIIIGQEHNTLYYNVLINAYNSMNGNSYYGAMHLKNGADEDIEYFYDSNGNIDKVLFEGGYITYNGSTPTFHFYIQDHLGNNRAVVNHSGTLEQETHYYPFGAINGALSTNPEFQPYKFTGKELDRTNGYDMMDYGARMYAADLGRWMVMEPLAEKYYDISPYAYCGNNPVNAVDIDGRDTINISNTDGKWLFDKPILAKGNDVFNVTVNGSTRSFTFSEGEYRERVNALNLDITDIYTLGIYHISGVEDGGTGYFVTPEGDSSSKVNSGARIPEGVYPIKAPQGTPEWRQPSVGGMYLIEVFDFIMEGGLLLQMDIPKDVLFYQPITKMYPTTFL